MACIISATSPDKPGALCFFIFFSAAITSGIVIQSAGPSFMIPFIISIHQVFHIFLPCVFTQLVLCLSDFFHLSLIPFSSTTTLPWIFHATGTWYHLPGYSNKCSAVTEMDDHLATTDMGRKVGLWGAAGSLLWGDRRSEAEVTAWHKYWREMACHSLHNNYFIG